MSKLLKVLICLCPIIFGAQKAKAHLNHEEPEAPKTHAEQSFEKLKALVGTWEYKEEDKVVELRYTLESGGTAVVEHAEGMMTVFTLDKSQEKGSIVATHYCEAGNQPRFRAIPGEDLNELKFEFLDITNLLPLHGYISGLSFRFIDADHVNVTWQWTRGDLMVFKMNYLMTRKQ
jgi:hypothetical protein